MLNAAFCKRHTAFIFPKKELWQNECSESGTGQCRQLITKTLLVVKLTTFLMLALFMNVHARGKAQVISLQAQNMPLHRVFAIVEKQTGFVVFYNKELLKNKPPVSVNATGMPLTSFLDMALANLPLTYEITQKTVVIKEKKSSTAIFNNRKIEESARILIHGIVRSPEGNPLAGASVKIKGTQSGTRTDEKGEFNIQAETGAVLVISFVGYEPYEYEVRGQQSIDVTLKAIVAGLKDVVVTGIFERSAKTYTGAAQTIRSEDIRKVGNQNILGVLAVLDPGIQIPQDILNGSDPNKIAQIRLRGASSLPLTTAISSSDATSNIRTDRDYYNLYGKQVDDIKNTYNVNPNLPLFILDGFEVNITRINDIDINTIQNITILKDASATAIYGSRGANGVIVVERIKPQSGKIRFGYKADITASLPDLHDYNVLNSREKLEVENLAGIYSSDNTDIDEDLKMVYNQRYKEMLRGRDTYWPSLPVRNSIGQRHALTMDGGNDAVTYGIDFSYNRENGVMKGSDRSTYNGDIYLNYRGKKFQLSNQLSLQVINSNNSPWGPFSQYVRMNPYFSPYDDKGNIDLYLQHSLTGLTPLFYGEIYNPVYNTTLNGKDFRKSKVLINNTSFTYNFTHEFSMRGRLSLTTQNDDNEIFLPAEHTIFKEKGMDIFQRGSYTAGYGKLFSYDANVDLNYNLTRGRHRLFTTLSGRANESANQNVMVQVQGLPSALTDQLFYGRNYVNDRPDGSEATIRTLGLLANANYSYDNRYFADFSYRLDGSSSLGSDKLFAPFWSVGAGWNLHYEPFLEPLVAQNIVSQLRVRGSIGLTGAQQFDPYMAYRTYNYFLDESYINSIGASLLNIGNDKLTWQGTRKHNIGTDMVLWDNRLNINADYYYDVTDKFIADFNLPLSTGFSTYKGNLGSIESKGWEVRASLQLIKSSNLDDFGLTLLANAGSNKSSVKKISNELKAQNEKLQSLTSTTSPFQRYEEGTSMDAIWVVRSLGIDPATGMELFLRKDGTTTFSWNAADMVPAGISVPRLRGSFGFSMVYKGFQLTSYLSYRTGGQQFNQTLLDRIENVNLVDNADRRVLTERWKNPGDVAFFKAISRDGSETNASSRFVQNDNTLEMTSFSLLYRVSPAKLTNWGLRNLNFGFYMNNLFRVSSIKLERGIDYPFARSFSFSIQTGF